jgi:hypothetical protein
LYRGDKPHTTEPLQNITLNNPSCTTFRDASAWAAEGGKLYVMGGSLGSLSGYTASVEVYHAATDRHGTPCLGLLGLSYLNLFRSTVYSHL